MEEKEKVIFGTAIKKIIRHTNTVNFVVARWIKNDNMGMKQELEREACQVLNRQEIALDHHDISVDKVQLIPWKTMQSHHDLDNIHKKRKRPRMQGTDHHFRRRVNCAIKTKIRCQSNYI